MVSLQTKAKALLLLLSFSILGVLLYFSDVGKVLSVISEANPFYVFLAFLISVSLMAVRTLRWKVLLGRINVRIPSTKIFTAYMSGLFASNLTPGKIGEPIKSYVLKKTSGISISKSLPSVFMERTFDVFIMVLLSLAGVVAVSMPAKVGIILQAVIIAYFVGVVLLLYLSSDKNRIYCVSKNVIRLFGWLPLVMRFDKYAEHFARNFNESIIRYKDAPVLSKTAAITLLIWCSEGMILYLSFLSVGINVNPLVAIFFLSMSVLIGVSSFLPGGLGSSEVVMVLLFTTTYSLPLHSATAAIFIERFFSMWINVIAGAVCMGALRRKKGDI